MKKELLHSRSLTGNSLIWDFAQLGIAQLRIRSLGNSFNWESPNGNRSIGNSFTWKFAHLRIAHLGIAHFGIAHMGIPHYKPGIKTSKMLVFSPKMQ
uniref:Uncharacterized protein n=1 Tax=Romanomermis culicivorax TaxID=13658 RepID=A0A915KL97_ROMCU